MLEFFLFLVPVLLFALIGALIDIRRKLEKIIEASESDEMVSWLKEIHQELKDINMNTDREVYYTDPIGYTESIGDADPEGETVDPCSENLTGKEDEKSE